MLTQANKIFFDYRESVADGGIEDAVFIALLDEGIITQVGKDEMFDTCMHHGCFLEQLCFDKRDQAKAEAYSFAKKNSLTWVDPATFRDIEEKKSKERAKAALGLAEEMIKNG